MPPKQPMQFPFALPATAPKQQPAPTVQKKTAAFAFGEPALFYQSNADHGFLAFKVKRQFQPYSSIAR
jgi:hypothetical protein